MGNNGYKNYTQEQIRTDLMMAILDYFEGLKPLEDVLSFGRVVYSKINTIGDSEIIKVANDLNSLGVKITNKHEQLSKEFIREEFTTMLETLTPKIF
jgi:hypothetical protein